MGGVHRTPSEVAEHHGMMRRDVINLCMEMNVPIFNGRIDADLFAKALAERGKPEQIDHAAEFVERIADVAEYGRRHLGKRGAERHGATREVSLALTNLDQARLWAEEHKRRNEHA